MRWMPARSPSSSLLGSGRLPRVIVYPPSTRITSPVTCAGARREQPGDRRGDVSGRRKPAERRVGHGELRIERGAGSCGSLQPAATAFARTPCGPPSSAATRTSVWSAIAPAPAAPPPGKGCVPSIDVTATHAARAALDRGGEPRLRGEERLARPGVECAHPRARVELGEQAELDRRRDGHQALRSAPSRARVEPAAASSFSSESSSGAMQEDAHQYFPTTSPPSTRM